jgi:superoxide reductase
MDKEHKFFLCKKCGNLVGVINSGVGELVCCGEPMQELVANTVEASREKHLPVVSITGNEVSVDVGSVEHPMTDEHYIMWIYLHTKNGGQRKKLDPGMKPTATFALSDDEAVAAFAYCNLHGLWKTMI